MARRFFFVSMALVSAACGGDDFTSSDGAGATSSSGASDGGGGGATATASTGSGAGPIGSCSSAGEVCLEKPSGSWQGPVVVSVAEGDAAPAPCAGDWPDEELTAFAGQPTGTISCAACSCDAPMAGGCAPPTVTAYSGNTCSGSSVTKVPDANGACAAIGATTFALTAAPSAVVPGQCAAHGGAATPGPVTWPGTATLCGGGEPGEECADGNGACFAAPGSPFAPRLCIYTEEEDATCPPTFPELERLHQGLTDTRGCTECDCSAEQNAVCIGNLLVFSLNQCTTGTQVPTDGATCKTIAGSPWTNLDWTDEPRTDGTCSPAGGEPKGELSPEAAVTVCCTPPL